MRRKSRPQLRCMVLSLLAAAALLETLPAAAQTAAEMRAARAFAAAQKEGPPALEMFLHRMPKGGDLHMHLSGAVYAETFLRDAAEDNLCVNVAGLRFDPAHHAPACPKGDVAASTLPGDQRLYDELVDSFSMRTFIPVTGDSGHDQFFDTFDRFSGLAVSHDAEWIDDVAARAAAQNEQYLEIMMTPRFSAATALAEKIGFDGDFVQYRNRLMAAGFGRLTPAAEAYFDKAEKHRKAMEHCG